MPREISIGDITIRDGFQHWKSSSRAGPWCFTPRSWSSPAASTSRSPTWATLTSNATT